MKTNLMLTMCFLAVCGCGLFGGKGVPKEQINTDIGSKKVRTSDDSDWFFGGDSQRCFAVNDDETKITDSIADVSVTVASWRDMRLGNSALFTTVFGKLLLHYKMDGGKWVLETVEPKELIQKTLEVGEFKKFVDIQTPICRYYRHTS